MCQRVTQTNPVRINGRVIEVIGTLIKAKIPDVRIGEICELREPSGNILTDAEVIGFSGDASLLTPYRGLLGLSSHTTVHPTGRSQEVMVGDHLLGRIIDGMGNPLDGAEKGGFHSQMTYPIYHEAIDPLKRRIITQPLQSGIRVLDGLLTCGEGQRLGIFAAAGVGKSTLLAQLVKGANVDRAVVALIGERGREVKEFIENNLGAEGMRNTTLVVATSDKSSMERVRAAYIATTVAEYYRDQGLKVLFLMDSVTRFARALREIGLAAGEPPTRRGFPPSVFATLPQLMERTGMGVTGSITAFYTVLVEGDDMTEPVADEVRSILDGHIILSRELAASGHYPAVSVLDSASRVMSNIISVEHAELALRIRNYLAKYKEVDFLIKVGEYQEGADAGTDEAVRKLDHINSFCKQSTGETETFAETLSRMKEIVES